MYVHAEFGGIRPFFREGSFFTILCDTNKFYFISFCRTVDKVAPQLGRLGWTVKLLLSILKGNDYSRFSSLTVLGYHCCHHFPHTATAVNITYILIMIGWTRSMQISWMYQDFTRWLHWIAAPGPTQWSAISVDYAVVCLSACLSAWLTVCLSAWLSACLSFFLTVCLTDCLPDCLSDLSLSVCWPVSFCLACPCLSFLSLCVCLPLSVCLSLSGCLSLSVSQSMSASLFQSVYIIYICLHLSMPVYVYVYTCLCLSISVYVYLILLCMCTTFYICP